MAVEDLRPYIEAGDWVVTEDNMTGIQMEGTVVADDEGTLRVALAEGADPFTEGHNVNARWINVLRWTNNHA